MAYNETLTQRIRNALGPLPGMVEKKMFGGIGFILNGNMAVGVLGDDLLVRISPDESDTALADPFVRAFAMTGRPMKGWVMVAPGGCESDAQLQGWIKRGVAYARALPPK
jgi:hypothetical protein